MSYDEVQREIDRGMPPDVLCTVCPWDRLCIQPPTMTADRAVERAVEMTETIKTNGGSDKAVGIGGLLAAALNGVQVDAAKVCPVLAIKLRSPGGRSVNDLIRTHMRSE